MEKYKTYEDLTLNQKISLKGLFCSAKERRDIGIKDDNMNSYKLIMQLWDFKLAINYFLNPQTKLPIKTYKY